MKDMLGVTNHAANSWLQRKLRPRGGKKEPDERKSATPRGDFPLPFFLDFFPTQASGIFQQHAGLERMTRKEIQVFLHDKQSYKCCLKKQTVSAGWKPSQALNRNVRERRSNAPNSVLLELTQFQKAQKSQKSSHIDLPEIVQGIHVAGEDSPVLKAKDERRYKGGRLWRRGGSVSLRGESGTHAGANSTFSLFHIFCKRYNNSSTPTERT